VVKLPPLDDQLVRQKVAAVERPAKAATASISPARSGRRTNPVALRRWVCRR